MAEDFVLKVPAEIARKAQQIAHETAQSPENVLLKQLQNLNQPALPDDINAELAAMQQLSDDALWSIAQAQLASDVQARAAALMQQNTLGKITPEEYEELQALNERADRMMLRKAEAADLLRRRGHTFHQEDFKPSNE